MRPRFRGLIWVHFENILPQGPEVRGRRGDRPEAAASPDGSPHPPADARLQIVLNKEHNNSITSN